MAIGFVANGGNRFPEQRRMVQLLPQYDTLCLYQLGLIPGTCEDLYVVHSFETAAGPNHPHILGNCGFFSCDKIVGGDDLRQCSAVELCVLQCCTMAALRCSSSGCTCHR
jgi:hypothetical protein